MSTVAAVTTIELSRPPCTSWSGRDSAVMMLSQVNGFGSDAGFARICFWSLNALTKAM